MTMPSHRKAGPIAVLPYPHDHPIGHEVKNVLHADSGRPNGDSPNEQRVLFAARRRMGS